MRMWGEAQWVHPVLRQTCPPTPYPKPRGPERRPGVRAMHPSQAVAEHVSESIEHAKPHLRGWLHLGILPLTLAGGILLVAMAPDARTRAGSAVFTLSALLLFGVSAAYHCGNWSPRTWFVLRRLDHCNIFLLVAGSCTAYALLLLDAHDSLVMLTIVWTTALARGHRPVHLAARAAVALPAALHRSRLGCAAVRPGPHPRSVTPRRRGRRGNPGPARGRRRALRHRRRRLLLPATGPVAPLVRLPRGLPRLHRARLRQPLRGDLRGHPVHALSRSGRGHCPWRVFVIAGAVPSGPV